MDKKTIIQTIVIAILLLVLVIFSIFTFNEISNSRIERDKFNGMGMEEEIEKDIKKVM